MDRVVKRIYVLLLGPIEMRGYNNMRERYLEACIRLKMLVNERNGTIGEKGLYIDAE